MTRKFVSILGVCAALSALPVSQALAQPAAGSAFADGVKGLLSLDYAGMSRDALARSTAWPVAKTFGTWLYDHKLYSGDIYMYPGADAGGKYSVEYDEVYVGQAHHFAIHAMTTHPAMPAGGDCLSIRDLRAEAAAAGWTGIQNYVSMLNHGFTAEKGNLSLDARVDIGQGQTTVVPPGLDDEGCVGAVTIKDVTEDKAG